MLINKIKTFEKHSKVDKIFCTVRMFRKKIKMRSDLEDLWLQPTTLIPTILLLVHLLLEFPGSEKRSIMISRYENKTFVSKEIPKTWHSGFETPIFSTEKL